MRDFLLLSTAVMIPVATQAADLSNPTFTHNTPVELASISPLSGAELKLAAVCFLGVGNCGDTIGYGKGDEDTSIDPAKQCKNEGFVSSCSSGYCMDGSCTYNKDYGKCITENCPTNAAVSCTGAVVGKNACGVDCKQCCVNSCPSGYTYKTISNGYIADGEPCKHCSQGNMYKIKENPCTGYTSCQYGPASGANSCLSGTVTKYNNCRPCTETCPSGTSPSNPGGCGGSTQNECRTKTCFYPYRSCCSPSCPSGYSYFGESAYGSAGDGCGGTCYPICSCRNSYASESAIPNTKCISRTSSDICGFGCYFASSWSINAISTSCRRSGNFSIKVYSATYYYANGSSSTKSNWIESGSYSDHQRCLDNLGDNFYGGELCGWSR